MRKLSPDRRAAILSALVEGMSIASVVRMLGVSKITVLRLLADAGTLCIQLHDEAVRGVKAERIEADELWSFCGCKAKAKRAGAQGHGDTWVWVGMDADTKLVISYLVGDRDAAHAEAFMLDLASRVEGRPQITTDGFNPYRWAVHMAFDGQADHAGIVKHYATIQAEEGRYSPPRCTGCTKRVINGNPDLEKASTSYAERQNLTVRMGMRRRVLEADPEPRLRGCTALLALQLRPEAPDLEDDPSRCGWTGRSPLDRTRSCAHA
jgi:IS1 family transposase